jgi:hypothetical protein
MVEAKAKAEAGGKAKAKAEAKAEWEGKSQEFCVASFEDLIGAGISVPGLGCLNLILIRCLILKRGHYPCGRSSSERQDI